MLANAFRVWIHSGIPLVQAVVDSSCFSYAARARSVSRRRKEARVRWSCLAYSSTFASSSGLRRIVIGFEAPSCSVFGTVSSVLMGYHLCTSLSNDCTLVQIFVLCNDKCRNMITLGQRLKEERKRLGMTQPE